MREELFRITFDDGLKYKVVGETMSEAVSKCLEMRRFKGLIGHPVKIERQEIEFGRSEWK